MTKLLGAQVQEWPPISIAYEWPRANEGGLDDLDVWLTAHPNARLVVIDTFVPFRQPNADGKPNYDKDYAAVVGLQKLANKHGIAIVCLHHTRKADDPEDPLNTVLGSVGIIAAADTVLVIAKRHGEYTLYGRGRDIEQIDQAIEFNKATMRWKLLGDRAALQHTKERQAVLNLLSGTKQPMKTADIVNELGKSRTAVASLLHRLKEAGDIIQTSYGHYALPNESAAQPNAAQSPF